MEKKKLAVFKLASCDGCQLTLLDCEDELLAITERITVANFLEASREVIDGPYDLALVEGSVTTPHDAERVKALREQSRFLVAIGACATAGGIQALRNYADVGAYADIVYPHPEYIETLTHSTPVADHVTVDFELRGCPISKAQLLETITAWLAGRPPAVASYSLCVECKRAQAVCVSVAADIPCLGPATQAGCGVLCPSVGRGCYGCFGPAETPNLTALAALWRTQGVGEADIVRRLRTYNAGAASLRTASEIVERGIGS